MCAVGLFLIGLCMLPVLPGEQYDRSCFQSSRLRIPWNQNRIRSQVGIGIVTQINYIMLIFFGESIYKLIYRQKCRRREPATIPNNPAPPLVIQEKGCTVYRSPYVYQIEMLKVKWNDILNDSQGHHFRDTWYKNIRSGLPGQRPWEFCSRNSPYLVTLTFLYNLNI